MHKDFLDMRLSNPVFALGIALFLAVDIYSGICGAFELSFEGTATGLYDHYAGVCKPFHVFDGWLYGIPSRLTLPPYVSSASDMRGDPDHPLPSGLHFSLVGTALRLLLLGVIGFCIRQALLRKQLHGKRGASSQDSLVSEENDEGLIDSRMTTRSAEEEWGIYPWFKEHDSDLVLADDLHAFTALQPYGKVFLCVNRQDGYLHLRYRETVFRVRPEKFMPVPRPTFYFGQNVRTRATSAHPTVYVGKIEDIHWHAQKQAALFYLSINNKKKSTQYLAEELEAVE